MSLEMEERIDSLLAEMTLAEKVAMCHADSKFTSGGVERLGIGKLHMSDGPHGVREEVAADAWMPAGWDNDYATYLPVGVALASTWNESLAHLHGQVLGSESRARGKDVILGPGLNIMRMPTCGRNFEYLSEDPHLTARIGVAVIKGIQENDVAACAKHFVLNSQELERHHVDACPDERTLHEVYLSAFEAAVKEARVLTVMGAYNLYDGQHCCHNERLLNDILKEEWGFEGLVVSDWAGCSDTDEAARFGLDIEMGTSSDYDEYHLGRAFREGVEEGVYSEDLVDEKVRRILRVMISLKMLDGDRKSGTLATPDHFAATRAIAREAMVLMKNANDLLPLAAESIRRIVVIGRNAARLHAYGGGSSAVKTPYEVSPLQGLQERLGEQADIQYFSGDAIEGFPFEPIGDKHLLAADESGTGGWSLTRHDGLRGRGDVLMRDTVPDIDLEWADGELPHGLGIGSGSLTWNTTVVAPEKGEYELAVWGSDSYWLCVDKSLAIEAFEFGQQPQVRVCRVEVPEGRLVQLTVGFQPRYQSAGFLRIGWRTPSMGRARTDGQADAMLTAVTEADAVLYVAGLDHSEDREGRDRAGMALPYPQDALIRQVAARNPNTAVLVVAGSPVEMPWIDDVASVLQVWYAGMETGRALVEILLGDVNPSGKLPVTFPKALSDSPAFALDDYNGTACRYKEGVFVGHRYFDAHDIPPLFPFGHGLSYTSFEYGDLVIVPGRSRGEFLVTCTLRNSGARPGAEVAQLYVADIAASVPRPVQELKCFRKAFLQPGESTTIEFALCERDLSFYDVETHHWTAEAGQYEVRIGASSRDIRLVGRFDVR